MSEIDQQFIEYVVKSLVGNPEAVQVDRRVDEKGVLLELTVDPEDLGRVIGKRGATAQSLRTLLRALGTKNDARYNLKIIDNGTGGHGRRDDTASVQSSDQPQNINPPQVTDQTDDDIAETASEVVEVEKRVENPKTPAKAVQKVEEDTSDRLAQTRKELAEFDDLDV